MIREVKEEFNIKLLPNNIFYERVYSAQKDSTKKAYFFVGKLDEEVIGHIKLSEGQKWRLFSQEQFFAEDSVIKALKTRYRDFLKNT